MSTFYDLPKTSLAVFQANDPSDVFRILFSALPSNLGFICHEECIAWHQEIHILAERSDVTFVKFSNDSEVNSEDVTTSDVIFADFDLYLLAFGLQKALRLVKSLKNKRRILIALSDPLPQLEQLTNTIFSIKPTENPMMFECSTTAFDKKGNLQVSDQLITIPEGGAGKPTFRTVKKLETPLETATTTTAIDGNGSGAGSMDLPFFVGRQEDGVAIRDAATKKIRVGGQIVYEPDRDDDLDDSDPDDDLNI